MDNGKSKDGFENVDGKPVTRKKRKGKAAATAPRAKDQHLPGMEPKTIPAVHAAIEQYVEARDNRMGLTKIEVEKRAQLIQAMKDAGIVEYSVDGHRAELEIDETVKAKLDSDDLEQAEEEVLSGGRPAPKKDRGREART